MASLTETRIDCYFRVVRDINDPTAVRISAVAASYTNTGQVVRSIQLDLTDQLTAARRTAATALLDDIEARVRTIWEIA